MSHWPRFGSKKAWLDNSKRQWHPAPALPEWSELNNFMGVAWYVLDKSVEFPEEGSIIKIHQMGVSKMIHMLETLDVSKDGFKCLVIISEV